MTQVGCAGILVEDTFCGPMRALPHAGALTMLESMPVKAGGCAANVAIDLRRQDCDVDVIGCVGADPAGESLIATLRARGVGVANVVRTPTHPTSRTVVVLIENEDRRYLHLPGANAAFSVDMIPQRWLEDLDVFYLGGLFALPGIDLKALADMLEFCRASKVKTVVDVVVPHGQHGMTKLKPLLPLIDVFVPNEDEARAFTGLTSPFDQLRTFQKAGSASVVITRGGQGAVALSNGKLWSCGTYQMNVVDPSGSGDAFASGVICGLLSGWDMPRTLRYASAVGASATRAAGTTDSVFSTREAEIFIAANELAVTSEHVGVNA